MQYGREPSEGSPDPILVNELKIRDTGTVTELYSSIANDGDTLYSIRSAVKNLTDSNLGERRNWS